MQGAIAIATYVVLLGLSLARPDRVERRALLVMGALLLLLQLTAGRGPKMIAALPQPAWAIALAAPVALAWMCLEAGLTEEFLFRVAFQTRAAAWLRSETAGLVAMAVLFGLAHAPGYVLRGAHAMEGFAQAPDPLTAAAYSIVVVSPIGLAFGVLWARTRSLLLVVLLHGWADLDNLNKFTEWHRSCSQRPCEGEVQPGLDGRGGRRRAPGCDALPEKPPA